MNPILQKTFFSLFLAVGLLGCGFFVSAAEVTDVSITPGLGTYFGHYLGQCGSQSFVPSFSNITSADFSVGGNANGTAEMTEKCGISTTADGDSNWLTSTSSNVVAVSIGGGFLPTHYDFADITGLSTSTTYYAKCCFSVDGDSGSGRMMRWRRATTSLYSGGVMYEMGVSRDYDGYLVTYSDDAPPPEEETSTTTPPEFSYNQVTTETTYFYNASGTVASTSATTTYRPMNLLYLIFKAGVGIWIVLALIKRR